MKNLNLKLKMMKKIKNIRNEFFQNSIISILLISFLSACLPQSKYNFEKMEIPEWYLAADTVFISPDSSSNIGKIKWSDYFKEEDLLLLIDSALKYNFDIREAIKSIEIVEELSKQSKLAWLPQVNANILGINRQYRSSNYYSNPSSKYYEHVNQTPPSSLHVQSIQNTAGLELNWELDIWGKIRSRKEAVKFQSLEITEVQKIVQTKIVEQVVASYYELLLLMEQKDVAESNYYLSKNTYSIVELQYESGNTTALAKQQTKSQMLKAKSLIPKIQEDIDLKKNILSYITGLHPDSIQVSKRLWSLETDTLISYGVPLELIRNRPDVRSKEFKLRRKNAELGVAQASRYPSLVIGVGTGTNAMLLQNWWNIPGSIFGSFIGGITQPIFNNRKLKTDFEVAKKERDIAELDFQRTAYLAVKDVSDALIIINSLEKQLEIAKDQFNTASKAIGQSNLLFNSGYATYIEIINAYREALDSELNLNQIRFEILLARLRLYKSLGGGWQ